MRNNDFTDLITRYNNGDASAFDEIYTRCCPALAFLCQKFCESKEDAEEVVQDTFVIAFSKPRDLRGDTLLAYLRKVATRECFRKRKMQRQQQSLVLFSLDEESVDIPTSNEDMLPEEVLHNKERQNELIQIVNSLSKNQREMTYLYYYFNFNTEEIARLYNCSGGFVRINLHRARQAIKNKLEGKNRLVPKSITATAFVTLGALFFIEEQVFAATYILPTSCIAAITVGGTATAATVTTASIIKGCVAVACLVCVGIVAAAVLLPAGDEIGVPDYAIHSPITESTMEAPRLVVQVTAPYVTIPNATTPEATTPQATTPHVPVPESTTYVPVPVRTEPPPQVTTNPSPVIGLPPTESPPTATPTTEPTATSPPPRPPPTEPYPYTPSPSVQAQSILARLEAVGSAAELSAVMDAYGFRFAAAIQSVWGLDEYRFYTLRTDCGDIMIGTITNTEDTDWQMRFALFADNDMPTDLVQRVLFMQQP